MLFADFVWFVGGKSASSRLWSRLDLLARLEGWSEVVESVTSVWLHPSVLLAPS